MRIAYFDCFSGISGDMIVGSLLDAGLDFQLLQSELNKLNLRGFRVKAEKMKRKSLVGTKFCVEIEDEGGERRLGEILEIIGKSGIDGAIKSSAAEIFKRMASVEGKVHDQKIEEVHFHEIGGLDTIVDVVSGLVGLEKLGVEAIYSSKVNVGSGFVETAHGTLPVPAPATVELLKGVPLFSNRIEGELATPTGAAILSTLSKGFGRIPEMKIERIGYGVGSREFEIPNLLRVLIGESPLVNSQFLPKGGSSIPVTNYQVDEVVLIETNIDDMSPELFEHVSERLMERGGLDVFMTPVQMKKGRPGILLSLLAPSDQVDELTFILFDETTTFGVRVQTVERRKLSREVLPIQTAFGEVKVKVGKWGEKVKSISPEYEDCRKIALEKGLPLKEIYEEAKRAAREKLL
ncbi:nickel pincer cofactor biosynthesis protein LarC [candidate division TA06 bacterium]|nr:nickel pincer cofactor biosynthesis protein LarC [candidate division TA06 bacterium]